METITITYEDHVAALAARERFWLSAHIQALADGHPTKRVIAYMVLFARDVITGQQAGPYSDERARAFARLALVDPAIYDEHQHHDDVALAAALELPVAEIPGVHHDQVRAAAA